MTWIFLIVTSVPSIDLFVNSCYNKYSLTLKFIWVKGAQT